MTTHDLSTDYYKRCKMRLLALKTLFKAGAYPDVVGESQELRENSFYGDDDLIPLNHFTKVEALNCLRKVEWMLKVFQPEFENNGKNNSEDKMASKNKIRTRTDSNRIGRNRINRNKNIKKSQMLIFFFFFVVYQNQDQLDSKSVKNMKLNSIFFFNKFQIIVCSFLLISKKLNSSLMLRLFI